jgi:hypothetical protein
MRLMSAKPVKVRPQSRLLSSKPTRNIQSAMPLGNMNSRGAGARPISKYRQEYEKEIDEIFEESELVGISSWFIAR